jgi:hypothetical protein
VIGFITYIWIVDFPENSERSFHFLTTEEQALAELRIADDRGDLKAEEFSLQHCLINFADPKLYGFSMIFFHLNIVSTGCVRFLRALFPTLYDRELLIPWVYLESNGSQDIVSTLLIREG